MSKTDKKWREETHEKQSDDEAELIPDVLCCGKRHFSEGATDYQEQGHHPVEKPKGGISLRSHSDETKTEVIALSLDPQIHPRLLHDPLALDRVCRALLNRFVHISG